MSARGSLGLASKANFIPFFMAVREMTAGVERDGRHGNNDPAGFAGFLERSDNAVALGGGGIDRNQVVVVQVDAPGTHFRQHGDNLKGRNRCPHKIAKSIASPVTDRPEPEGKLMFRTRLVVVRTGHNVFSMPQLLI